eukprot:tig00020710_g13341.t1
MRDELEVGRTPKLPPQKPVFVPLPASSLVLAPRLTARRPQIDAPAPGPAAQFPPLPVLLAPRAGLDLSRPMLTLRLLRTSTTMSSSPATSGALPPIVLGPLAAPAPALNVNAYNEVEIALQPVELRLDGSVLLALVAWAKAAAARRAGPPASHERALHALRAGALAAQGPIAEPKRYLIGLLRVEPLALDLTFRAPGAGAGPSDPAAPGPGLPDLLRSLGAVLGNVEGAPLRLSAFEVRNYLGPMSGAKKPLGRALAKQAAPQVAAVLASAGILGSPAETLGAMWRGLSDLVTQPIEGAQSADGTLAGGVARGAASFVRHTLLSPVHATGKVAGALARGVDALMLDDAYAAERARARGERPEHLGHGLLLGGLSLGRGIAEGIAGVVAEPVRGARDGGVAGFGAGLARGLVGLPGKPLGGLLDLLALTLEGLVSTADMVHRSAGGQSRAQWARLPRALRPDGSAAPYSGLAAEAQWLLLTPGLRLEGRPERLLGAFAAAGERIVAVTDARVVCMRRAPRGEGPDAADAEEAIARGEAPRQRGRPLSRPVPASLLATERRSRSVVCGGPCGPCAPRPTARSASAPPEREGPLGAWGSPGAAYGAHGGEEEDNSEGGSHGADPSGLRVWDARSADYSARAAVCAREEDAAAAALCLREALAGFSAWTRV